jgi:hypothetical protein
MKKFDLEKALKATKVPERSAEYWEEFPRRVVVQLNRPQPERQRERRWQPRLALGLGLGFACLAIGFLLRPWDGHIQQTTSFALLQNEKLIRETLAMFPNQVRAIEQDENGLRLVLSEKPDVPASPPLWIRICEGKRCRTTVTFSGQNLQIAKEKVEVLADAQGQVMLVGDRLFWSGAERNSASGHLRIQARTLTYAM